MNLAQLQRHVARAVMTPLTPAERMRRSTSAVAKKIIKPNDRLTSFERLEIYNRQYWFRVLDAFSDDFPGLRAVLGDRSFDSLAKHYLTDCPSRSFTMRDLGSRLETWLRKHPSYARGRMQLALDMVRLEWAEIETFDAASLPPLTADSLRSGAGRRTASGGRTFRFDLNARKKRGALAPEQTPSPAALKLCLQPYIRLLDLHYPVDDLLLAVKHDPPPDMASNAMEERQKRKKVAAVARLNPVPVYLAIHRVDDMVYFRRLDSEEFTILQRLQKGRTLERAIVAGFRSSKIPLSERAPRVAAWFQNWSSLGWFV
jgi:Putative DNA-binding domain